MGLPAPVPMSRTSLFAEMGEKMRRLERMHVHNLCYSMSLAKGIGK